MDRRSLTVVVEGQPRTLADLPWNSTVGEVVEALAPRVSPSGPRHVLLECWHGCSRALKEEDFVFRNVEEWGDTGGGVYSSEPPSGMRLVLCNAARYCKARGGRERERYELENYARDSKRRSTCTVQTHGKIALAKRRSGKRRKLSKTAAGLDVPRQIRYLRFQLKKVEKITKPVFPSLQSLTEDDDVFIREGDSSHFKGIKPRGFPLVLPGNLSPEQEEELLSLKEELEDEQRENTDLLSRRAELLDRNYAQERELGSMRASIDEIKAKISAEESVLLALGKIEEKPGQRAELEEVTRLTNELKVRSKLNQLQSTKMQELNTSITMTEEEIQKCTEQVERLKLQATAM